jgi:thimet oligopeptidase
MVMNFEKTPKELIDNVHLAIENYEVSLNTLTQIADEELTFKNTFQFLEEQDHKFSQTYGKVRFLWNVSPNKALRDEAQKLMDKVQAWSVQTIYREDIYNILQKVSEKEKDLMGEDLRLMVETLKYYKRIGINLPKSTRDTLKIEKSKLNKYKNQFKTNIKESKDIVNFTEGQLDGVPSEYLEAWVQSDGSYIVDVKIFSDYAAIMRNALRGDVRKQAMFARRNIARKKNIPLLKKIIQTRSSIAKLLGYKNWASYRLEPKMAKNPETVFNFLNQIRNGIKPKLLKELDTLKVRKQEDFPSDKVMLEPWDTGFYASLVAKEKHKIDSEKIKEYFEMKTTLAGMFRIYEKLFHIEFEELPLKEKIVEDMKLFLTRDAKTGEPLGLFYTDLFPREGKHKHFAMMRMVNAMTGSGGINYRPTVALVGNFSKPTADRPSLLTHGQVKTLFHEFGHVMHSVLTRAKYASFAGTNVPRDFSEAPAKMLENWVWDQSVISQFSRHYATGEVVPMDLLHRMKEVQKENIARRYSYQVAISMVDMQLHSIETMTNNLDVVSIANNIYEESMMQSYVKETAFVANIGHLMGYDAGYYGYLWADSIAEDLASKFELSKGGYLDVSIGLHLRNEIYSMGNTRDVNISIEKFLGRKKSINPFLKKLGIITQ